MASTIADEFTGTAIRRALIVLGLIAGLSLVPCPLSPSAAESVALVGLGLFGLAAGAVGLLLRRALHRVGDVPVAGRPVAGSLKALQLLSRELRRVGLAFAGLAFFLFWTFVIMLIWSADPASCPVSLSGICHGAYRGLGTHPAFGDFFSAGTQLAFGHRPVTMVPFSRLAQTAEVVELISGIIFITTYAGAFLGLKGANEAEPHSG